MAALVAPARELWEYLAGTAAGFAPAISVAVAPRSSLCPPGWAGIVVIGDAVLATAPDHGKLPQWRARPEASRRIARALGFRELGSQVSIRPVGAVPSHER